MIFFKLSKEKGFYYCFPHYFFRFSYVNSVKMPTFAALKTNSLVYNMINRVLIRLKIIQIVYAYYQNGSKNLDSAEKELFYYGDWIRKPGVAICSCNDGLRPVIFKLEATDEISRIDDTPVQ